MPIDSEDRLKGCIDRIFKKVLLEKSVDVLQSFRISVVPLIMIESIRI